MITISRERRVAHIIWNRGMTDLPRPRQPAHTQVIMRGIYWVGSHTWRGSLVGSVAKDQENRTRPRLSRRDEVGGDEGGSKPVDSASSKAAELAFVVVCGFLESADLARASASTRLGRLSAPKSPVSGRAPTSPVALPIVHRPLPFASKTIHPAISTILDDGISR